MQSPLGHVIAGARPGAQRTYSIPSGANLPVTLPKAVPYGVHLPNGRPRQSVPPRRNSARRRPEVMRTDRGRTIQRAPTTSRRPLRYLDRLVNRRRRIRVR